MKAKTKTFLGIALGVATVGGGLAYNGGKICHEKDAEAVNSAVRAVDHFANAVKGDYKLIIKPGTPSSDPTDFYDVMIPKELPEVLTPDPGAPLPGDVLREEFHKTRCPLPKAQELVLPLDAMALHYFLNVLTAEIKKHVPPSPPGDAGFLPPST
ncbi:MAG TPA: hypothetical protein PKX38_00415 [Alphaproteobacteria bacterium]|nr:hypothetical protein [Micavibrio sp.]HQX26379.1 hypothetical protein [Alphaproteobacteria bacterium]